MVGGLWRWSRQKRASPCRTSSSPPRPSSSLARRGRASLSSFSIRWFFYFGSNSTKSIPGGWLCGDSPERVGSFLQCSRHRRRCSLGGGQAVIQAVGESGHSCFPNFKDCVNMLWFPWSAQGSQNQCCYSVVDICPYSFFQNTSHDEDGVVVKNCISRKEDYKKSSTRKVIWHCR